MLKLRISLARFAVLLSALACFLAAYGGQSPPEHTVGLENGALRVVVADNETFGADHRAGYNGVADLRLAAGDHKNLFVPSYAGLNLEHVFSGDAESFGWNIFEPRRFPMQLIRHSTNCVELRQERTEHWPLRSRLVYELKDDAIDFTYYGTPLADFCLLPSRIRGGPRVQFSGASGLSKVHECGKGGAPL
jgi:hypothetical protein